MNPLENNNELFDSSFKYLYPCIDRLEDPAVAQIRGFNNTLREFIRTSIKHEYYMPISFADGLVGEVNGEPTEEQINIGYAEIQRLMRKAWKTGFYKAKANIGTGNTNIPISFKHMVYGIGVTPLYTKDKWPTLNNMLIELQKNKDASEVFYSAMEYYDVKKGKMQSFLEHGYQVITTMDLQNHKRPSTDEEERKKFYKEYYNAAPYNNPGKDEKGNQRYIWLGETMGPYLPASNSFLPKGNYVRKAPNILIISSTEDPATPYGNGVVAAKLLGGTLVTVANSGHTTQNQNIDSVNNIRLRFMSDPEKFYDDMKNGDFENEKYTGKKNVLTRNIEGRLIRGTETQLHTFHKEKMPEETTKPETTNPEITKPETTKPETTKPETTKPEITKQDKIEHGVIESGTTELNELNYKDNKEVLPKKLNSRLNKEKPQTGDNTNIIIYIIVVSISFAFLMSINRKRKKQ